MRYAIGTMTDLTKIRRALKLLAGYPPESQGELIGEPWEVSNGNGIMEMPTDADEYLGQSIDVDGVEVFVPNEGQLYERTQLPQAYQDFLYNRENQW